MGNYEITEASNSGGKPIELYSFHYSGMYYNYTSAVTNINSMVDGVSTSFNSEYIKRDDSLKTGSSDGSTETTKIYVTRANSIGLLYQGTPPEDGGVSIIIYRYHEDSPNDLSIILRGVVSHASFQGSEVTLTITIENILENQIPTGTYSYYCQNSIYDFDCKLNKADYEKKCWVDKGFDGLKVKSTNLLEKPSGYYTRGFIKMGNCWRAVVKHEGEEILLKYPINESEKQGSFTIYPGCDCLFTTCAKVFGNTDNFSGVPYTEPTDSVKNKTGKGAYWVDSSIIKRDSNMAIGKISM